MRERRRVQKCRNENNEKRMYVGQKGLRQFYFGWKAGVRRVMWAQKREALRGAGEKPAREHKSRVRGNSLPSQKISQSVCAGGGEWAVRGEC